MKTEIGIVADNFTVIDYFEYTKCWIVQLNCGTLGAYYNDGRHDTIEKIQGAVNSNRNSPLTFSEVRQRWDGFMLEYVKMS